MPNDYPAIVRSLYDCALSSEQWSDTLDRLCPLVNAKSAILFVFDQFESQLSPRYQSLKTSSLFSSDRWDHYVEHLSHHEASHVNQVMESRPGEMICDPDFLDREQILQRPDVRYVAEHFGIVDRFGIRLNDDKAWADCIAFQYPPERGVASPSEYLGIKDYVSHIAQVVSLGRMMDSIRQRYSAVLTMLDKIQVGMLLVRSDGLIILKNSTASSILENHPKLSTTRYGYLASPDPRSDRQIRAHIAEQAIASHGQSTHTKQIIKVGHELDGNELLIEFSPLRDADNELGEMFCGTFVLLVDPYRPGLLNMAAAEQLYGLSASESTVAQHLFEGLNTTDIAESRGVSNETIRSQVKSVYRKTGTASRAELLRKLFSISLPFADS